MVAKPSCCDNQTRLTHELDYRNREVSKHDDLPTLDHEFCQLMLRLRLNLLCKRGKGISEPFFRNASMSPALSIA
jgi:hypothetical protein